MEVKCKNNFVKEKVLLGFQICCTALWYLAGYSFFDAVPKEYGDCTGSCLKQEPDVDFIKTNSRSYQLIQKDQGSCDLIQTGSGPQTDSPDIDFAQRTMVTPEDEVTAFMTYNLDDSPPQISDRDASVGKVLVQPMSAQNGLPVSLETAGLKPTDSTCSTQDRDSLDACDDSVHRTYSGPCSNVCCGTASDNYQTLTNSDSNECARCENGVLGITQPVGELSDTEEVCNIPEKGKTSSDDRMCFQCGNYASNTPKVVWPDMDQSDVAQTLNTVDSAEPNLKGAELCSCCLKHCSSLNQCKCSKSGIIAQSGSAKLDLKQQGSAEFTDSRKSRPLLLQRYTPVLRSLDISYINFPPGCLDLGRNCLRALIMACPGIQKLSLTWNEIPDDVIVRTSNHLKDLRSLSLVNLLIKFLRLASLVIFANICHHCKFTSSSNEREISQYQSIAMFTIIWFLFNI